MSTGLDALARDEICVHCGNPTSSGARFCCRGCEFVFDLLQSRGLSRFYALKSLGGATGAAQPAPEPGASYDFLENTDVRKLYEAQPGKMRFYLQGVHCAACVWLIEKVPEFALQVRSVRLDFGRSVASVELLPGGSFAEVAREFHRLGYRPTPVQERDIEAHRERENRLLLIRTGVAAACAGNIMLMAVALYGGASGEWGARFHWISLALYLPVVFFSAVPFYKSAWSAIRARTLSIDIPIVLGLAAGSVASVINLLAGGEGRLPGHVYFDSLAALVFLLLGSRYLLKRTQQRALSTAGLARFLTPATVRRKTAQGGFEEIATQNLAAGDVVEVRVGELIPGDGTVLEGQSMADNSLLTGEAAWVPVRPGERVFAGTVNQHAPLLVEVSEAGARSRLGQILQATADGAARKAPIITLTDRLSRIFVGATLFLAFAVFAWALPLGWQEALNRALAMVIVTCPCALALATPLAMVMAMGRAAKMGIVIQGSDVLEKLSHVDRVYLDKTGTLTHGSLVVLRVERTGGSGLSDGALAAILVALESRSSHPIARAIVEAFRASVEGLPELTDFEERLGHGVSARIAGVSYELGRDAGEVPVDGISTVVALFADGKSVARIVLGDRLRADSAEAVRNLRAFGVRPALLSGDRRETVAALAKTLGIGPEETFAAVSPEEKSRIVAAHPRALMVGDGANDSIALSAAYVGVAVHGGMEVSLRVADAYIRRPGVVPVHDLLVLGRETMRVVRRNLFFSAFYNVAGVAAAIAGWVDPLFAAILMPLSAFTVFGSSLAGTRTERALARARGGG